MSLSLSPTTITSLPISERFSSAWFRPHSHLLLSFSIVWRDLRAPLWPCLSTSRHHSRSPSSPKGTLCSSVRSTECIIIPFALLPVEVGPNPSSDLCDEKSKDVVS